jgi:hypothetical protein
MRDEYEEPESDYERGPPYPGMVRAAGIIWIVFGGLILLNLGILLLMMFVLAQKGAAEAAMVGGVVGAVIVGLFGGVFIHVGVQSVAGTATDTLGNGIGSIIFALLNFAGAVAQAGNGNVIAAVVSFLCGGGLLAAGILALIGRADYKAWRRARVRR